MLFPPSLRKGLKLDVKLVCLYKNFPSDVTLELLYQASTFVGAVG